MLGRTRRIVVKIGSRVIVRSSGRPEMRRVRALIRELALQVKKGREIVFVTSGAIGSGMEVLGMRQRPTSLPDLQMAAAVGQCRLMTLYSRLFAEERCTVGQVLLTHDDLKHRSRHLNARNTVLNMLRSNVIPIVNENDVVAVDEIRFGDNDLLASLVTHLIDAELLILLTMTDGLRQPLPSGRMRRVPLVKTITKDVIQFTWGKAGQLSTGGMASKLEFARHVAKAGAPVVIADGCKPRIIARILDGEDTGTLFVPLADECVATMSGRKRWLAFFHKPQGRIVVDDGARRAIEKNGKSLLSIGIKKVEGDFQVGAAVDVLALDGALVARGLTGFSSRDVRLIQGHRTNEIPKILGIDTCDEVIHRDNMVLMTAGG